MRDLNAGGVLLSIYAASTFSNGKHGVLRFDRLKVRSQIYFLPSQGELVPEAFPMREDRALGHTKEVGNFLCTPAVSNEFRTSDLHGSKAKELR